MFNRLSIVASSVLSAIEGRFGDYHAIYRTRGDELFINPLMSSYRAFRLPVIAERNLYLDAIRETERDAERHPIEVETELQRCDRLIEFIGRQLQINCIRPDRQ